MIDCTSCVHFSLCTCANDGKDECVYYEPERPHGEWKYESYGQYLSTYKCSNCGFHGDKQWISCPYCDAKMEEGGTNE